MATCFPDSPVLPVLRKLSLEEMAVVECNLLKHLEAEWVPEQKAHLCLYLQLLGHLHWSTLKLKHTPRLNDPDADVGTDVTCFSNCFCGRSKHLSD